mmetsp:Transcript_65226/g.58525  ORF Transcript_65226/g.58525 Transcript_65226/m.58525 type:complete len:80 (+) Transcript_65226:1-240(+)
MESMFFALFLFGVTLTFADDDRTLSLSISESTLINLWSMVGLFTFVCGILLCCHWIQHKYEQAVKRAYLPTVYEDAPLP